MQAICVILALSFASSRPTTAPASAPTSAPADATLDWLLDHAATTAPLTRPAQPLAPTTQPSSPFVAADRKQGPAGSITFSDGTVLRGRVSTTEGKPLRFWDEQARLYRDLPLGAIRSLRSEVLWERDEPEWVFRTSGSDEKVFTGRTYPARELQYTVTLNNGQRFTGATAAPLYVTSDAGTETRVILHKRDKGAAGQTLRQLVYIKVVDLGE